MESFTQKLSDKDLRRTLRIHYFGYKYTLITPVIGGLVTLYLLFTLISDPQSYEHTTLLLMVAGVFFMIRPRLYISKIFANIKSQKISEGTMTVQLTEDEKVVSSVGESKSIFPLKDLYAHADKQDFLFLYVAKNNFLALDKREMPATMLHKLTGIMDKNNIKKRGW
jgi:hypothetical protein